MRAEERVRLSCCTVLSALFVLQIMLGIAYVRDVFNSAGSSVERCEEVLHASLPGTPCMLFEGQNTTVVPSDLDSGRWNTESVSHSAIATFWAGALGALGLAGVSYWRARPADRERGADLRHLPRALQSPMRFLRFTHNNNRFKLAHIVAVALSLVIWLFYTNTIKSNEVRLKTFLNPDLNDDQFLIVMSWFMCDGTSLANLFVGDIFFLGFTTVAELLRLMYPYQWTKADVYASILDLLYSVAIVWAFPVARHASSFRQYSLLLLSGLMRALRVFLTVPELAKSFGAIRDEDPGKSRGDVFHINRMLREQYLLWSGELALLVKVLFYMFSCTIVINALEGWPCEFDVKEDWTPCDCFNDLLNFRGTMYFLVILMSTVGFGDLYPHTTLGRYVVMLIIGIALYVLPLWLATLKKQHMRLTRARQRLSQQKAQQMTLIEMAEKDHSKVQASDEGNHQRSDGKKPSAPLSMEELTGLVRRQQEELALHRDKMREIREVVRSLKTE